MKLVNGDITRRVVDVIVSAANDQLSMGGGVAGAIRSGGGISIHTEALEHAPAKLGSVVRTGAGELLADHVYHAVVIRFDLKGGTSAATVREVVRSVLARAVADDVATLALPLFGAGVGGLSIQQSLETILDALEEFAPTVASPLSIEVVVLGEEYEQARTVFDSFRERAARDAHEARLAEEWLKAFEEKRRGDP